MEKHLTSSVFTMLYFVLIIFSSCKSESVVTGPLPTNDDQPAESTLFKVQGDKIVAPDGSDFHIKGVAFGNQVWINPALPPPNHHGQVDFERVAAMGFNSIRFYLNYRLFEDDHDPYNYHERGFEWIDQNIGWARDNDIYLILNMHVPQGGFQSLEGGGALWDERGNQQRLIALWQEIARRYAGESRILGFDLVNEPVVTQSIDQWIGLAEEIVEGIREVNADHMIFIERLNANLSLSNPWDPNQNGQMNYFLIDDPNIVYQFHFYLPFAFTHQNAHWIPSMAGVESSWPDEDRMEAPGGLEWSWATFENPLAQRGTKGTTDWTFYEGVEVTVTDENHVIGRPALQGNAIGEGTVWFDDITLVERDADGNEIGNWTWDFTTNDNFYYWSDPVQGQGIWSADEGRDGSGCWKIAGSGSDAVLSDGVNSIALTVGHSYQMSGWMRTKKLPTDAQPRVRLDFYESDGEVHFWNREYLEAEVERYLEFGRVNNVPIYLGEFGCIAGAFEKGRGGLLWVEQMLDICSERGVHYNYHTWHETAFGIFLNPPHLPLDPSSGNQQLIDLFTRMQND